MDNWFRYYRQPKKRRTIKVTKEEKELIDSYLNNTRVFRNNEEDIKDLNKLIQLINKFNVYD